MILGVGSGHIPFLGSSSIRGANSTVQRLVSSAHVSGERRVIWSSGAGVRVASGISRGSSVVGFCQPSLLWRSSLAHC